MNLRELLQQISECDNLESKVYVEAFPKGHHTMLHELHIGSANSKGVFLILGEETEDFKKSK